MKAITVTETKRSKREQLLSPVHEQGYTGRLGAEPCYHQTVEGHRLTPGAGAWESGCASDGGVCG